MTRWRSRRRRPFLCFSEGKVFLACGGGALRTDNKAQYIFVFGSCAAI